MFQIHVFFFFLSRKLKEAQRRDFMFILSSHGTQLCIIDAQLSRALEPFWRSFAFWGWLIIESYGTTTPVREESFNGKLPPVQTWQRLMMRDEEQLSGSMCSFRSGQRLICSRVLVASCSHLCSFIHRLSREGHSFSYYHLRLNKVNTYRSIVVHYGVFFRGR